MPLSMFGKSFATFDDAVAYCMRIKGMTKERALKYVGTVQAAQEK